MSSYPHTRESYPFRLALLELRRLPYAHGSFRVPCMRALSTAPVADSCAVEVCKSCVNSADRATRQATPAPATVTCTPRMLRLRLPMRRCRCETANGWRSFVGAMAASCCCLSSAIQESSARGMACVTPRRGGGGDSSDPRGKASTGSHCWK